MADGAGAGLCHARLADGEDELVSNVPPDARFPWWSFTKCAIAACSLILASRGRLSLDKPVPGRAFTLRQLLGHRAGVPNYGSLPSYHAAVERGEAPWSEPRLLEALDADRLLFEPGTGWAYSNVGYLFARRLVEEASGLDLGETVRTLLCEPLGLSTVSIARTPEDLAATRWGNPCAYHPGWVYHGLLTGSAGDACRLLRAVLCGELLTEACRRELLEPFPLGGAVPGRPWTRTGYGLGVMSGEMTRIGAAIGHSGVGPRDVCAIYRFPDAPRPCIVAVFDESSTEDRAEHAAAAIALGAVSTSTAPA